MKRGLATVAGVFCTLVAATDLWVLANDPPDEGDPAAILWGLGLFALAMAVASVVQRRRPSSAAGLAALSFALSALWWFLIVASAG